METQNASSLSGPITGLHTREEGKEGSRMKGYRRREGEKGRIEGREKRNREGWRLREE